HLGRAATAREVTANNRSEWGKRMVALGNGYPPVYGYPDFDKIRLQRQMYGQPGFDGSEAEDTVRDAVYRARRKPQGDQNDDHSSTGGYGYKTQSETAQPASVEVEGKPKKSAYPSTKTSGASTPTSGRAQENMREPANASPTNNQAEANGERVGSYGVEVPRGQLTTRGALPTGEVRQEERQTCGATKTKGPDITAKQGPENFSPGLVAVGQACQRHCHSPYQ
ncbi:hypothetical protein MNBD_ALPHA05-685, partial [hydrothermal vent metagenome]